MSSISSVTSGTSDLTAFPGSLSTNQPASSTAPAADTAASSSDATQQVGGAKKHHHHKHGGGDFKKVQDAVTSALNAASANPKADANKLVENAIAGVLKAGQSANGVGAPKGSGTDSDGDHDGSRAGSAAAGAVAGGGPGGAAAQSFSALLQKYGIDPQQFRADFAAAVKDVQAGKPADPALALGKLPPGSVVDTQA